jgi:hypothetical protein
MPFHSLSVRNPAHQIFQTLFTNLEAAAKRVLPQNRQSVKSYIQTGGLSELWIVINSLNKDGLEIRGRYRPTEWAPLNELREEIMHKETTRIQSRLERIMYQLESPETVLAVLGTHRLEGVRDSSTYRM